MDEETAKSANEEAVEESAPEEESESSETETPEEESQEEPQEEPAESQEETPAEEPQPSQPSEPSKPSRRENLRIQKLLAQNAELRQKASITEGLDYKTALDAEPEVIQKLEADRKAAQETAYNQGLEQAKSLQFHTRLEIDAPKIESKYPQLDSKSSDFNAATADAINTMYLRTVGYNPETDTVQNVSIRYADYVESIMELAEELAGNKVNESSKNIAKQAASTALRPDGSQTKRLNLNKPPEQMEDEELQAIIAQAIPSFKK